MRKRFSRDSRGRIIQSAVVYTAQEHRIDSALLDSDAVKAVRRLQRYGHEAYIVGGAVRDLLLGKHPKDFDVSTSATPAQIRKLFRNSRIIGKRFRLVHLLFRDKVIEVSTFRSRDSEGFKNVYGTLEEDVLRRDFSANALFFNPRDNSIVDFVSGVRDISKRVLRPVIPLQRIFTEDPVRIIRAVKYSVTGGMRIPWTVRRRMRRDQHLLKDVPYSRMTEELFKILNSGYARGIMGELLDSRALAGIVPAPAQLAQNNREYRRKLLNRLQQLDEVRHREGPLDRAVLLAHFCADYLLEYGPFEDQQRIPFRDGWAATKDFLKPVTPANREVEHALKDIFRNKGRLLREEPMITGDEEKGGRNRRRRRPRGRRTPAGAPGVSAPGAGTSAADT